MKFKVAAWCAIVSAVLCMPYFVLVVLSAATKNMVLSYASSIIAVVFLPLGICILLGYLKIANILKIPFLKTISYVMFGILALGTLYTVSDFLHLNLGVITTIVSLIIHGIVIIIFGVAILKLKETFGGLAIGIGVLCIIEGAFFATVILTFLVPLTETAIGILEALLFFKAEKSLT
ncbi:MAG: hypothetical protein JSW40_01320 [Candidatus Omnitrophota bacterium]|nr:MAG: hypothetical protein JSW40_01320 [Candidatus Omnitrophota bacterium]